MMRSVIHYLLLAALVTLVGCQPDLPSLSASQRSQLTDFPIVAGQLSPDAKSTFLLRSDNKLHYWNNVAGQLIAEWDTLDDDSLFLTISDDGRYILTASQKALSLWQVDQKQPLGSMDLTEQLAEANITAVAFWRAPNQFLIGTSAGTVIVADVLNQTYRAMQHHEGEVTKFAKLKNSEQLLTGGNDGLVVLWNMRTYEVQQSISTPFRITSVATSSTSTSTFISDALDKQYVWQPVNNRVVSELDYWQQYKWFRLAEFIHKDSFLITTSPKTEITLWDLKDNEALAMWNGESHSLGSTILDMSYIDDNYLITLSSDAVLQQWDVGSLLKRLEKK